jgi:DNA-binding transcriptional regulator YhcF (GntR family)
MTPAPVIRLDPLSPTPPFEQLRAEVISRITNGTMIVGTRLPTVRALAADLGLAPNTVARAYRELEADGFIETRGRNGSFVQGRSDSAAQQAQRAAHAYAERIRDLGVSPEDAVRYVHVALGE